MSFAARRVHNVIVYVHTAAPPTEDDWDGVLGYYQDALDEKELRTLVYTDGAAPSASQRARLNAVLGPRRVRIAVLTPSALARAAGTAIGWFRPEVRVFGATDLGKAMEHLSVAGDVAAEVGRALDQLKQELGIRSARRVGAS
jgi:hypothetical protein